ncbi:sensor domain-containing protein [Salinarimonas soli]|uniref:sensor domain-containing protein n=1 Tax=Salinarimonas soli TaxID=1638099 RepID=UPI0016620341|nr:EAL domain-containing protein [Salinarimonas soli]
MSERLLVDFAEIASDWFWEMDADLRFSYFSARIKEVTGVDPEHAIGRSRFDVAANAEDRAFWRSHFDDLLARRAFRDFVYPYQSSDGRTLWFKISGQPVFAPLTGAFLGYRGVGSDITLEHETRTELERTIGALNATNRAYVSVNAEHKRQHARLLEQETALRDQTALLEATLSNMDQGLMMFDAGGRVLVYNQRVLDLLGLPEDLMASKPTFATIAEFQHRSGSFRADDAFSQHLGTAGLEAVQYGSYERTCPDGTVLEVRTVRLPGGGAVRTYTDVTTRKRQELALREREDELTTQNLRFDAALSNMPHGLCLFDAGGHLILCNAAYARMYRLPEALTRPGTQVQDILAFRRSIANAPVDAETYVEQHVAGALAGTAQSFKATLQDGRIVQVTYNPMAIGGYVATHEDVTEAILAEARIAHMARHDALTGLPNRTLLRERMEEGLARVRRGQGLAVLCLDLDHFKAVNDTLGHPVGDLLLRAATKRIKECVRETDTVARLGGDEFTILQAIDRPEQAGLLARRIIEVLRAPFGIEGHQVVIGTSVGVTCAPSDGLDPDVLLKNADMALYRAKADGRGACRFFEPAMDARLQERRRLELDLRRALAASEFELYYQPLVNAQSSEIIGFEALLRWNHPERGQVPPAEFIPLAEEIGLIIPLGEWVLRDACREAAAWPRKLKVAVNLSPVQFRSPTLLHTAVSALGMSGLSPHRLELEITESVLLHDSAATLALLHQLRALGVRIAMDDFGTGYSSLSYLRSFPFDKIKIDRSFVRELGEKSDCLAIVKAVAGLGASLGITTTAEGVETPEQLDRVREQGCTEVQGYLFSRPRPASEVRALIDSRSTWVGQAARGSDRQGTL